MAQLEEALLAPRGGFSMWTHGAARHSQRSLTAFTACLVAVTLAVYGCGIAEGIILACLGHLGYLGRLVIAFCTACKTRILGYPFEG